ASGHPIDITVNVKPATIAECPMTPCTYVGKKLDKPIIKAPEVSVAILANAIKRCPHNFNGIIGALALVSHHKNTPNPRTKTSVRINVGDDNQSQATPPS